MTKNNNLVEADYAKCYAVDANDEDEDDEDYEVSVASIS